MVNSQVLSLKREIREYMMALKLNTQEINYCQRKNQWIRMSDLLLARTEILKSICHRQGKIIEILTAEVEFNKEVA